MKRKKSTKFAWLFVVLFFGYFLFKSFSGSLFLQKKDRVNFFIYDPKPVYYSLSRSNGGNYKAIFDPQAKVQVPGGYSYYRFGALGKLVALEKQENILKKVASTATQTFVDFYFHSGSSEVHYDDTDPTPFKAHKLLYYKSNANFFDRLYIFFTFVTAKNKFVDLEVNRGEQEDKLDIQEFAKLYQGYLYHKSYRNDNRTVQIIYTKGYTTALNISNILEGSGIRVADISESDDAEKCWIVENSSKFSLTAKDLSKFFGCRLKQGQTGTYDIIFTLGQLEKEWEIAN